jgi:hypothetical protein
MKQLWLYLQKSARRPPALIELPHTISSATPLCSQQAVLHRCVFAKTLHNTTALFCFFSVSSSTSLLLPLRRFCHRLPPSVALIDPEQLNDANEYGNGGPWVGGGTGVKICGTMS